MLIGLDVDGVCADFTGALLSAVGGRLRSEDITSWELFSQFTPDELRRTADILQSDSFWRNLPLLPFAWTGVRALREAEHEIVFVTSPWLGCDAPIYMQPCVSWEHARRQWLGRHLQALPEEVIVTHKKHLIRVDVLIDDKPSTVRACSGALLFSQPHNASETDLNRTSWATMLEDIK